MKMKVLLNGIIGVAACGALLGCHVESRCEERRQHARGVDGVQHAWCCSGSARYASWNVGSQAQALERARRTACAQRGHINLHHEVPRPISVSEFQEHLGRQSI